MDPIEVRVTRWILREGATLLHPAVAVGLFVILMGMVYLWYLQGATVIWASWLWRSLRPKRGHSSLYVRHLRSPQWQRTRLAAIRRSGGRCSHCGVAAPLDVHHLTYDRLGKERSSDVVALCRTCHNRVHGKRSRRRWRLA